MQITESWPCCPEGATLFRNLFSDFADRNPQIRELADRFYDRAGVDIHNVIDHWTLPASVETLHTLRSAGYQEREFDGDTAWVHPGVRLPRVRFQEDAAEPVLALMVEDIDLFLAINSYSATERHGDRDAAYEEAICTLPYGRLAVTARRGYAGFRTCSFSPEQRDRLVRTRGLFKRRERPGDDREALAKASSAFCTAANAIGRDRAVHEFFTAEREYYMSRNKAATWHYETQQALGIGWANHDHHTYRCSRALFQPLINLWLEMGFESRERFYAGVEAGWGAQVLEHPVTRIVLFCDVDVAPEELNIDFSTVPLPPRDTLGTIGLWCGLHGDSIGKAGLHHLEAEWNFTQAEACQKAAGFGVMPPFTDLPMLKQAFTEAEIWRVDMSRISALRAQGLITAEQADKFVAQGAPGSHLEILQRWDGFKGFNKTGISDIILQTDARLPRQTNRGQKTHA
jgi:hypothetical protein